MKAVETQLPPPPPPVLKIDLKVHYVKLNCYNSSMILNTDLRLVSFKEDNQQIIAEVNHFKKKVKKYMLKFTVNKMNCTIFILFYKK